MRTTKKLQVLLKICPPRTRSPHLNLSQPPFEAWYADLVHPHFYSGWQLGDASVFPPLQLVHSPPAGRMLGDTAVSFLQCTEPVPATRQSNTSLSIIVNKDAKGSPSRWRVPLLPGLLDTPSQVCLPLHDTLLPLSHFLHEWEHLPGVSLWVLRTVRSGYTLQFGRNPGYLAPARIPDLTACLARFKLGHHVSVGTFRRLLGLMAAASPVLPLGLLHMRPFLWWMKELRLHPTVPATRLIRVSRSCCRPLLMWRDPVFLLSGVRMGAIYRRHMITTDASMTGWGAVFEGRPASGEWKEEFLSWHINCLELRAIFLALKYFLPVLGGYHIIVRTDNMAVVSHINRQGGSWSRTLDRLARHLLLWSQDKFLSLRAVHVPGILNLAADFLSRQKLRPGEWMLNRQTVSQIWDLFGKAEVDLFASQSERFQSLTYPLNIFICVLKLKVL